MTFEVTIPSAETVLMILGVWSIVGPVAAVLSVDKNKTMNEVKGWEAIAVVLMMGPSVWIAGFAYLIKNRFK